MPTASALPLARRAVRTARLVAGLALAALIGAACDGGPSADDSVAADLVGRFEARGRYVPLAEALALTGLDREIENGTFTILAPTETALRYIGSDFQPVLFAEPQRETLRRVLRHHIVAGRLEPEAFTDGATLTTLAGTTLRVRRIGPVVTVNGITVDVSDPLEGSNGVAYPAADVLLDVIPTAERVRLSPILSTVASGLRATGLLAEAEAAGPFTVLAPINDALAQGSGARLVAADNADIYRRALRALVLPGTLDLASLAGQTVTTLDGDRLPVVKDADGALFVGGVRVLRSETTSDGYFYVLASPVLAPLSVADRIRIEPALSSFAADLLRSPASLALLSDRSREVTVFAPLNTPYFNRGPETSLVLSETPQLPLVRRLVANHVFSGRYLPEALTDGLRLTTTDGEQLEIRRDAETIIVDGFPLPGESFVQSNGIIYTSALFFLPSVDLMDTILLNGYAGFFRAIRQAGMETEFRTTVRTAFVLPDNLATPAFRARPDLRNILRWTSTTDYIPNLEDLSFPYSFTTLSGRTRQIGLSGCTPTPQIRCSPYWTEDTKNFLYMGRPTDANTAAYHYFEAIDLP